MSSRDKKTAIFVLGQAHTGSTMLDAMLGNGPGRLSCGEVYAWYRPWRRHHRTPECTCGDSGCQVWLRRRGVPERHFHSYALAESGGDIVVDSSKNLSWLLDSLRWCHADGIAVRLVLIWKPPAAIAESYRKRRFKRSKWAKVFVRYYGRIIDLGLPFTAIEYDELIAAPEHTLARLNEALGLNARGSDPRFWLSNSHIIFGSGSVQTQMRARAGQFNKPDARREELWRAARELPTRVQDEVQRIASHLERQSLKIGGAVSPLRNPWWYHSDKLKLELAKIRNVVR